MSEPNVSLIVAASENNAIGIDGQLPWHLSADLKRFRKLTTGHHIIMGRKTFDSIGRLLPDRTTIIVTRNQAYFFPGALIKYSVGEALSAASDDPQPFIVGGSEIYRQSLDFVSTIYLTRVHTRVIGDAYFPDLDPEVWVSVSNDRFEKDRKNDFDYTFEVYNRRS